MLAVQSGLVRPDALLQASPNAYYLPTRAEDLESIEPFLQRYAEKLVYSKNHVANLTVDVSKVGLG